MEQFVITQTSGYETFFFGSGSPLVRGFSLNPESAMKFPSREAAELFISSTGLLDVEVDLYSRFLNGKVQTEG